MNIRDTAREYLRQFPDAPSRRIARWMHEKYAEISVEQARDAVRYFRGQHGADKREELGTDEFLNQSYELPLPSTYDSSEFIIPESNILILSDIHFPFQENLALETTLDWAKEYSEKHHKIEAILLNGDVIDCYQLSRFVRDPRLRKIKDEIDDVRDFFDLLTEEFGVPIYFKYGNHEERFESYIFGHAEELADLVSLEDFVTKGNNVKVIKDKRVVKIGHLNVLHGHEFQGGIITPVNPARTFFLRAKAPTLGGHQHTTSEHSGRAIDGKLITCWSTGCLCHLKPKYRPINEWNHGFALARTEGETFRVLNLRIENGVVY